MLFKILCVALVTIIASSVIKQYKPDLGVLINICGGVLIVIMSAEGLSNIIDSMITLGDGLLVSDTVVNPILKVLGVGYLTEFSADIAEDAGNKSISSKILFGGKIAICVIALPIIINVLKVILSLL